MNILGNNLQPISDDQELAKVLAGVSNQSDDTNNNDFSMPAPAPAPATEESSDNNQQSAPEPQDTPTPEAPAQPAPAPVSVPASNGDSSLDSIKQEALHELRPLVDKLEVSAEEKFDTYLLLLRSTDDRELIAPAHEAARAITDEARRAQALLDIIKEIDYLSNKAQTA